MVLALSLLASLATPAPAHACSCMQPPPPREALERAAAVFEGMVVTETASGEGMQKRVDLRVSRRWKGPASETISLVTPSSSAACGISFENTKSYLVYADEMDGGLMATLCSRTRGIELAGDDVAALGPPLAEASGDPVATRPAPATLQPEPPPSQDGGGCACGGHGHGEIQAAMGIPMLLFGLRKRRSL